MATISQMARIQGFDINKIVNPSNKSSTGKAVTPSRESMDFQVDKYTPSNTPFTAPNWNHMLSKSDPIMSDEEFEKAIWDLAWEQAANGLSSGNNTDASKLRRAYVSVVSPDRKAAYAQAMSQTGGKLPTNSTIYGSDGRRLMHHSPGGFWLPRTTQEELSRMANFNRIYLEAYKAYEAEYGKVELPYKPGKTHTTPSF